MHPHLHSLGKFHFVDPKAIRKHSFHKWSLSSSFYGVVAAKGEADRRVGFFTVFFGVAWFDVVWLF